MILNHLIFFSFIIFFGNFFNLFPDKYNSSNQIILQIDSGSSSNKLSDNTKDFNFIKLEERVNRHYCLLFHSFGQLELKKSIDIVKNNNNKIRFSLVLRIYLTSGEEIVIHSYFSTKYQDKTGRLVSAVKL